MMMSDDVINGNPPLPITIYSLPKELGRFLCRNRWRRRGRTNWWRRSRKMVTGDTPVTCPRGGRRRSTVARRTTARGRRRRARGGPQGRPEARGGVEEARRGRGWPETELAAGGLDGGNRRFPRLCGFLARTTRGGGRVEHDGAPELLAGVRDGRKRRRSPETRG